MNAVEFADKVNKLVENCGIPEDKKDFLDEILLLEPKRKEIELSGDFLEDLYGNYAMSGKIIAFDFHPEIEEHPEFRFFASQDSFLIGIDKSSRKIVMYDSEKEEIYLSLAENVESFAEIVLEIFEYGLPGWCHEKKYSKNDRKTLFLKLEGIVKDEYLQFYEQSYNS